MNNRVILRSKQIYGFLLRFYPKRYRQEFGEEMKYVFSETLNDAYAVNGEQGIIYLWARTIMDAGQSLIVQHVENLKEGASMKIKNTNILMQNKNILLIALAAALILLVPFIAMQFTDDVTWSLIDFAFAGALLFGTGLAFELITRKAGTIAYRAAVGLALVAAMLLVWINLAVGIIGSEDNPANMLYLGVLAILFLGALIARFRSQGMVRTLFAAALAQVLVTVIALMIWKPEVPSTVAFADGLKGVGVNALFVVMWVGSALLFRWSKATQNRRLEERA
jgi:hypothetical protein